MKCILEGQLPRSEEVQGLAEILKNKVDTNPVMFVPKEGQDRLLDFIKSRIDLGITAGTIQIWDKQPIDIPDIVGPYGLCKYQKHADNYVEARISPDSSLDQYWNKFTVTDTSKWLYDWRYTATINEAFLKMQPNTVNFDNEYNFNGVAAYSDIQKNLGTYPPNSEPWMNLLNLKPGAFFASQFGMCFSSNGSKQDLYFRNRWVDNQEQSWFPWVQLAKTSEIQNQNLFDNSYWRSKEYIINQRGQSSYSGAFVYAIDRWQTGDFINMTIDDKGLLLAGPDNTTNSYIFQRLENLPIGTYTFSLLFKENTGKVIISNWVSDAGSATAVESTEESGLLKMTFTTLTNLDPMTAYFRIHSLGTCRPIAAKLELGNKSTLAYKDIDGKWILNDLPPSPALELAKCQRYYWRGGPVFQSKNSFSLDPGHLLCNVQFPVRMRISPAVTISSQNETHGVLSYWVSAADTDIPVQVNTATLSPEGFNDLITGLPLSEGITYSFRVIANADF